MPNWSSPDYCTHCDHNPCSKTIWLTFKIPILTLKMRGGMLVTNLQLLWRFGNHIASLYLERLLVAAAENNLSVFITLIIHYNPGSQDYFYIYFCRSTSTERIIPKSKQVCKRKSRNNVFLTFFLFTIFFFFFFGVMVFGKCSLGFPKYSTRMDSSPLGKKARTVALKLHLTEHPCLPLRPDSKANFRSVGPVSCHRHVHS